VALAAFDSFVAVETAGRGNALPTASRTMRRCTFNFFDTPAIVPTPNSYSLRILFE